MSHTTAAPAARRVPAVGLVGVALTLLLLGVGLWWAKWQPYSLRIDTLSDTRAWSGGSIFGKAGEPGAAPSLTGAWQFSLAYFAAVWKAALVAVVVAAALESLVPRRWLVNLLDRRTPWGQGLAGGALSMPSMMCSCCTAPVAASLRRSGAPLGASVAYWLGNPVLNPAVLVFLALTMPWQFTAVRAIVGVGVVVGAALLVGRLVGERAAARTPFDVPAEPPPALSELPGRFVRTLARYLVILVPEYLVLVFLTGLVSGWLSNFAGLGDAAGPLALLLVGVVGAALVIPTAGEIPVVVGLVAAGASLGVAGVLLIALPALSIPSMVMVARAFSVRATVLLAGWVVLSAVAAGALLTALG